MDPISDPHLDPSCLAASLLVPIGCSERRRQPHSGLDDHLDRQAVQRHAASANQRAQARDDDGVRVLGAQEGDRPGRGPKGDAGIGSILAHVLWLQQGHTTPCRTNSVMGGFGFGSSMVWYRCADGSGVLVRAAQQFSHSDGA